MFLIYCRLMQVGVQRLLLLHPKSSGPMQVIAGRQPRVVDRGLVVQVKGAVKRGF